MKKRFALLFAALLAVAFLGTACALPGTQTQTQKLNTAIFNEQKIVENAKTVVTLANRGAWADLLSASTDDMKTGMTQDTINQLNTFFQKAGPVVSYDQVQTAGAKHPKTGEDLAVVGLQVKHQNQTVVYNISMDKDSKLVGFFVK